jgi:hypothetical protein
MELTGRVVNGKNVAAEALVLDRPFSFIGDFDPKTGKLTIKGHPLDGKSLAKKILVCVTGKGGTIAPFTAYEAGRKGNAPVAILCEKMEPIICECALVMDIPILDGFTASPVKAIRSGQMLSVSESGTVSFREND